MGAALPVTPQALRCYRSSAAAAREGSLGQGAAETSFRLWPRRATATSSGAVAARWRPESPGMRQPLTIRIHEPKKNRGLWSARDEIALPQNASRFSLRPHRDAKSAMRNICPTVARPAKLRERHRRECRRQWSARRTSARSIETRRRRTASGRYPGLRTIDATRALSIALRRRGKRRAHRPEQSRSGGRQNNISRNHGAVQKLALDPLRFSTTTT